MSIMKNSGIEWIGKVPLDWEIKRIEKCFYERRVKVSDIEFEPLSVTKKGIVKQLETAAKTNAHDERKLVCKGDFVINSRSDRKQSCGLSDFDGSVSLINTVLINRFYYPGYLKYILNNYGFAEEFYRWGTGIVADLWSTNYNKMKKISLPVPPLECQQNIANYLDSNICYINNIIEKTKESIEEYKKLKQSIITEVVTKGLNPDVKMKDSGVEWIGEIPEHWRITKYKYLLTLSSGEAITNSMLGDDLEFPVYGGGRNIGFYNSFNVTNKNLIIGRVGANCGGVKLIDSKAWATDNSLIVSTEYPVKLVYYILVGSNLNKLSESNAQPLITSSKILKSSIAFTFDKNEQNRIIEFLDSRVAQIDKIIQKKDDLISELEVYKKSLIYEVVTGKREIPTQEVGTLGL